MDYMEDSNEPEDCLDIEALGEIIEKLDLQTVSVNNCPEYFQNINLEEKGKKNENTKL